MLCTLICNSALRDMKRVHLLTHEIFSVKCRWLFIQKKCSASTTLLSEVYMNLSFVVNFFFLYLKIFSSKFFINKTLHSQKLKMPKKDDAFIDLKFIHTISRVCCTVAAVSVAVMKIKS